VGGEDISGEEPRDDTDDYLDLLAWKRQQQVVVKMEDELPIQPLDLEDKLAMYSVSRACNAPSSTAAGGIVALSVAQERVCQHGCQR
jgi:hypothetical protein